MGSPKKEGFIGSRYLLRKWCSDLRALSWRFQIGVWGLGFRLDTAPIPSQSIILRA